MDEKITGHTPNALSDDLLEGAHAIAEFLFGTGDEVRNRRKIYHLVETSRLPVFRLGSVLCARKSVLLEFIGLQEKRIMGASQR